MPSETSLHLLLEAIEDPRRLETFVRAIRDETGASAALVRVVNTNSWRFPLGAICGAAPFTPEFFAAYDTEYARIDAHSRVALRRAVPRATVYFCHEHYTEDDRRGDPYFAFLARHDIQWTAGYMAHLSDCEIAALCLVRTTGSAPFGDRERERIQPIADNWGRWGKAFWAAQRSAAASRAAVHTLAQGRTAVCCVDEERRPLWRTMDEAALNRLGLEIFEGRIRCRSQAANRRLQAAVARAIYEPGEGPQDIVASKSDQPHRLIVSPDGDADVFGLRSAIIAAVPARALRGQDLRSSLALTPSERAILGLLTEGLSPQAVADRRGVAVTTVQTQIKRMYRKAGVHSLAQLIARAMRG